MSKIWFWLFFCLSMSSFVRAADAKLVLVGTPSIVVNPLCNPDGTATVRIKIRNQGDAKTAAIPLYLSLTDITSNPVGKRSNGTLLATPVNGPNDDQPSTRKMLGPGEELWIKIDGTALNEPGEWEATLQNENVDVGKIRIIRNELPLPISMDISTPDAPELTFVRDRPASFRLKNDGSTDYLVTWEYIVDGHSLRPTDDQSDMPWWAWVNCTLGDKCVTRKVAASPVLIPRNGVTSIEFPVPRSWFGGRFVGLFKDSVQDGRLVLSRVDTTCKSIVSTKIFNVKTHMATNYGNGRELWSDVVIFFVLLMGGICSLTLNFALPNQMRRQKLKEKLGALGRQVSGLSTELASRLRVFAGLEQRLLGDRLRNLTWNNPDFTTEMQNIELASTQLDKRIQLLDRMGSTRSSFENLSSLGLPPTVIVGIEALFIKVGDTVKKPILSDTEIQAAQAQIQNIQDQMDSVGRSNGAWVSGMQQRVADWKADFDATNGVIGKTTTWKRMQPNLRSAESRLTPVAAAAKVDEKDYLTVDRALFKMELSAEYVRLVDALPQTDPLWLSIQPHEADLIKALQLDSWTSLDKARCLLAQMRQGQFAVDVSNAVTAKKVQVKFDRVLIRQFEPCEFWMEFPSELDNASARSEWTCRWEFTNKDELTLHEEGWQVTHYFQKPEEYGLKVTIIKNADRTTVAVDPSAVPPIKVQEEKRRRWLNVIGALFRFDLTAAREEWKKSRTGAIRVLELLWLILTMILALIGMIEGAKEQILKLDIVPAMIAIFLVGFGADQIKNLLTKKPS
ncbi:MAG TPA: hypothetical protein VHA06_12570 [Candidatus Angelobacter sp.]|nr:hypothetical protein [Candidatus Angelobacter sp.]